MELKKVNVLGINIDDVSLNQAVEIVKNWLGGKGKHYVVTPNPEFIMAAQSDAEFKDILNKADLAIPDGAGLKLSGKIKNTVAGVDLMEKLCRLSGELTRPSSPDGEAYGGRGFTVGFLGGRQGVAKKTAECLQKKYPGLKVVFAEDGGGVDSDGNVIARNEVTRQSNIEDPHVGRRGDLLRMTEKVDLLFVGFGQVKQEKWIAKNLEDLPVKVMMGVGGSFDEVSGKVLRCPKLIQKIGLKWLFRLVLQPWRIKRQFQLLNFIILSSRT